MSTTMSTVKGIAELSNLHTADVALERALSRSYGLPGMVCMSGPSGWGKTVAATIIANRRRAYYVQARSVWTKKATLQAMLQEMSIRPAKVIPEMLDQVAQELAQSGRPLIIDEMDYLVDMAKGVSLIRDIYEASQGTIMVIGEEGLPDKLKRHENFHGRFLAWVKAQPITIEDARKLVSIYSPEIEVKDDLLKKLVELSHGSVRRVSVNLELIQEEARDVGWSHVGLDEWGSRELYTGEAPRRRKF